MLNEEQVRELLGELQDPFLHKSLAETKGVTNVSIKAEKAHVSVRIAIAKTNTPEQMTLQMKVVEVLKENGAASVGIRFEELPAEVLQSFRGQATESEAQDILSPLSSVQFMSIESGKGRVRKSTVDVKMVVGVRRLCKKDGLIDVDIYGFSVPDMMGVTELPVI